jgi:hypothetical protein
VWGEAEDVGTLCGLFFFDYVGWWRLMAIIGVFVACELGYLEWFYIRMNILLFGNKFKREKSLDFIACFICFFREKAFNWGSRWLAHLCGFVHICWRVWLKSKFLCRVCLHSLRHSFREPTLILSRFGCTQHSVNELPLHSFARIFLFVANIARSQCHLRWVNFGLEGCTSLEHYFLWLTNNKEAD